MAGPRRKDLTGKKFNKLIVSGFVGIAQNGDALWECRCACGKIFQARGHNITSGNTASCGCFRKELHTRHGLCHVPEYSVWEGMIQRCTNPKAFGYEYYGGRGIKVCAHWRDFANFLEDMGRRPGKGFSIERINGNGDYEPKNCMWATKSHQQRNLRTFKANKTGYPGVFYDRKSKRYIASISVNDQTKYLGCFSGKNEAIEARKQGEAMYWGLNKE